MIPNRWLLLVDRVEKASLEQLYAWREMLFAGDYGDWDPAFYSLCEGFLASRVSFLLNHAILNKESIPVPIPVPIPGPTQELPQ